MKNAAPLLLLPFALFSAAPASFQVPPAHRAAADSVVKEILECRFENAIRLSDAAYSADAQNPLAAVLHLVAIGMRDVDADYMIDSAAFARSFERAKTAVDRYESLNGPGSYTAMLRGFTLGIHASFHLKNNSYLSAAGTGLDAIKMMKEAREINPSNTEVNFFLGLYDYARADLKKRLWWVLFWFPGDKQSGIRQLEEGMNSAKLTNSAAALALSDIYLQEKQPEKSLAIITRLKSELPNSRFLLWAEVKYYEDQKMFSQAAQTYGKLADAYESDSYGAYNGAVARNKQAHMHDLANEKVLAANTCKRLIERGGGTDKRARAIIKDTEKLLERLGR